MTSATPTNDAFTLKVYCTACGQKLAISTRDLRQAYRCPRCRTVHASGDLIDKGKTVPAVPVDDDPTYEVAMDAVPTGAVVAIPPVSGGPRAPEPTPQIFWGNGAIAEQPGVDQHLPRRAAQDLPSAPTTPGPPLVDAPSELDIAMAAAQLPPPMAEPSIPLPVIADVEWRGMFASFCRRAERLDGWFQGKRAVCVGVAAFLVLVAAGLDVLVETIWFTVFATLLFWAVASFFLFARMLALRDESGRWTLSSAIGYTVATTRLTFEGMADLARASPAERWLRLSKVALFAGLTSLAARPPFAWFFRILYGLLGQRYENSLVDTIDWTFLAVGVGFVGIGALFGLFWWRARESRSLASGLSRPADPQAAARDVRALPGVLDLTPGKSPKSLPVNEPVLAAVLTALSRWKPQKWCRLENDFRGSLMAHLRNELPDAALRPEFGVATASGQGGRIDLVVANLVALELKRRLDAGGSQRARAQVEDYLEAWRSRGPLLLVLCETAPGFETSQVCQKMERLHAAGEPVVAVAAGRRSRW